MDLSHALEGLSPEQLMRYGPQTKRWPDTKAALKSGTKTTSTTTGATRVEGSTVSPTSTGLQRFTDDDLWERISSLETAPKTEGGPPLDLYRTEAGENGDVYIATNEYREWFLRTYPRAGGRSEVPRPAPGGDAQGSGGTPTLNPVSF